MPVIPTCMFRVALDIIKYCFGFQMALFNFALNSTACHDVAVIYATSVRDI